MVMLIAEVNLPLLEVEDLCMWVCVSLFHCGAKLNLKAIDYYVHKTRHFGWIQNSHVSTRNRGKHYIITYDNVLLWEGQY